MRGVCNFTDYFVICSTQSERQIKAIYEDIRQSLKEAGVYAHSYEGTVTSGWLLIDFGDVIVHIFSAEEREVYKLDRMWNQAATILRIQ
jgi:ribosome-associated protein